MIPPRLAFVAGALVVALAASPALAAGTCPTAKTGEAPSVYAIGSSTMGSVLGPMLKRLLKEEGITKVHKWGKASSGLARPDFHDWPKTAPGLMRKHKPDVVIVSLGTNDFQNLFHDGKWIDFGSKRWEAIYGQRVDAMLEALGGEDKKRLILWTGPTAFDGEKAIKRAPRINTLMKERVDAYAKGGGNAVFVDAYAKTSDGKGRALAEAELDGKTQSIRAKDGIHLTTRAVRWLMAEPILAHIRPCVADAGATGTSKVANR